MAAGPLHPDNLTGGRDRDVRRGHGTRALGPSDSSDSASDIVGAALDGDSDRNGTGESASVPGDVAAEDEQRDIDTDHIEQVPPEAARDDGEDEDERPVRR